VNQARAVFIIPCRCSIDKDEADQHTILRSWAIKEFSPLTPQYVQLFRPENRIHIKFVGKL
jgi:potassium channel subfamily T member 1